MPILQVDGRFMAGLAAHAEHGTLVVRVEPEQRALLLDEAPDTYYLTPYHEPHPVVLVRLHRVDRAALWDLLAESPLKTTPAYGPGRWNGEQAARPDRRQDHLRALAVARWLYEQGRGREQRLALAETMAGLPAMRQAWFRSLARELRRPGARYVA